ncbi:hypothetical protein D3C85_756160 [compost metagenome]
MIDEPHHRAAWAEVLGDAQSMAKGLFIEAEQTSTGADHANPGKCSGGMIFGGAGHQRDTGAQGRFVADAQHAEQLLAADATTLLAAGVDQRQHSRYHSGAGMALGGEVAFMGVQAVDAETTGPGRAQRMHRATVEQQAASQAAGPVVVDCVLPENLAGLVIAGTGGNPENIQQAGLQQRAGRCRRLTETEIADKRIERHAVTPQTTPEHRK